MDKRWSLDTLYKGLDSKEFLADARRFKEAVTEICQWSKDNLTSADDPKEKLETYIKKTNDLAYFSMLSTYCQLLVAVDSSDYAARKYEEGFQEISTELVVAETLFIEFIRDLEDFDELIDASAVLKEHGFYLKEMKARAQYVLSEKEETVISKMAVTGSMAWSALYDQVTSLVSANLGQEELPLSMVRHMAYDSREEVRKKAYEAEIEAFQKIDVSAAACLNAIKGEVITECGMRGYESPLDMTIKNSRMDRKTLDAMLGAIREYLPLFNPYFKRKAKTLGDAGGLKYYNLFAPIGEISMDLSYEDAAKYIIRHFSGFSKDMGDYAAYAFENRWLDVEPRRGKSDGAFCAGIHQIGESRILSNFQEGSFESLLTLAHELGHGYHGHCLKNESYLNSDYPMPIAETASTFCETLICHAARKELADDKSRLAILENQISGAIQVIVDIYARYLFETNLFEARKNGSLSVDELKELMVAAQKEAYGDGLDEASIHPYMWAAKGHYYDAGFNFYNFPYAYGHLFCLGLYTKYLEEGESFPPKYRALLQSTGANDLSNIGRSCGIDVHDGAFWRSSLKVIKSDIDEYVKLSEIVYP